MAIPNKIKTMPIEISIIFNMFVKPNWDSGKLLYVSETTFDALTMQGNMLFINIISIKNKLHNVINFFICFPPKLSIKYYTIYNIIHKKKSKVYKKTKIYIKSNKITKNT